MAVTHLLQLCRHASHCGGENTQYAHIGLALFAITDYKVNYASSGQISLATGPRAALRIRV
jgi:hypothetical protein